MMMHRHCRSCSCSLLLSCRVTVILNLHAISMVDLGQADPVLTIAGTGSSCDCSNLAGESDHGLHPAWPPI